MLVIGFVLLALMFIWVSLLQSAEAPSRRFPPQRAEDIPDLREDDTSPQFTGRVA
jgi:hypothetical protein